jgi:hypothetical protein
LTGKEKNFVYSHLHPTGRGYQSHPAPVGVAFGGSAGNERIFIDEDFSKVTIRHHAVDKTYQSGALFPDQVQFYCRKYLRCEYTTCNCNHIIYCLMHASKVAGSVCSLMATFLKNIIKKFIAIWCTPYCCKISFPSLYHDNDFIIS